MHTTSILSALSTRRLADMILMAKDRVIYASPGIQREVADAITQRRKRGGDLSLAVCIDFDEDTLRMGYGTLEGVETLRSGGVEPTHFPGFRSGILIVDDKGWVFTPTALYLEKEPQSDETPNAVRLSPDEVRILAIRLSPDQQRRAVASAATAEEAQTLTEIRTELAVNPVEPTHYTAVKSAITRVPPVKFDVVRQVRVFEPYLQYIELALSGAAIQRHRVGIPKSLQSLGTSKVLEGKLRTTFDLIEKNSSLSSKPLEDELNAIRKNFTPSLGHEQGRVVLKSAKPVLNERIEALREKLNAHKETVKNELQAQIELAKKEVGEHYLPLAVANPPDAIRGMLLYPHDDLEAIKCWIESEIDKAFPKPEDIINEMRLEARYKDVTYETLNHPDFLESVKAAFPHVDWDKTYKEFRAAGESDEGTERVPGSQD